VSLPRYAARRDANEHELVTLARQLGAQPEKIGPLDWWIGWRSRWVPLEIKTEEGSYTDKQVLFLARCKERQLPVWTWRAEADVYRDLGARRSA
jgi:hypothetical protein